MPALDVAEAPEMAGALALETGGVDETTALDTAEPAVDEAFETEETGATDDTDETLYEAPNLR